MSWSTILAPQAQDMGNERTLPSTKSECHQCGISDAWIKLAVLQISFGIERWWIGIVSFVIEHRPELKDSESSSYNKLQKLAFLPGVRDHNTSFRDEITLINVVFCCRMRHSCKKISFFFSAQTVPALTRRCHRPPSSFGLPRRQWISLISALTEEFLWQWQWYMGDPWDRRIRVIFLEGLDQAPPVPLTVSLGNKASRQRWYGRSIVLCLQHLQRGFRKLPGAGCQRR